LKVIGIIQPNYIPWRGYFDFIREVDVFIFLDDVQFTRRDWRTRNRIKLPDGGTKWLTVPVKGGRDQLIHDVRLDNAQNWTRKHWESMRHCYGKSPHFGEYSATLEALYEPGRYERLVDLNVDFTVQVCSWLGLAPRFLNSSDIHAEGAKDDRLLSLVEHLGGDVYLSGPAARDYIRPELWSEAGVELRYKDYDGYPAYRQISEPFEPAVTVLDLLFMTGAEAPDYIWGRHRSRQASQESA
jgi:hypothetical protein